MWTIIPWWPFISHGLGTLVKAGVLKVTQAFVFLSVWKEDFSSLWPLRGMLCVLTLLCYFFPLLFSCVRVSDCPRTVTQSALLTQKRAFTGFCDFLGRGDHNLKCPLRPLKSRRKLWFNNVIYFLQRERKKKTLNHRFHSSMIITVLLSDTSRAFFVILLSGNKYV